MIFVVLVLEFDLLDEEVVHVDFLPLDVVFGLRHDVGNVVFGET